MDYWLTDANVHPPDTKERFTECLLSPAGPGDPMNGRRSASGVVRCRPWRKARSPSARSTIWRS